MFNTGNCFLIYNSTLVIVVRCAYFNVCNIVQKKKINIFLRENTCLSSITIFLQLRIFFKI